MAGLNKWCQSGMGESGRNHETNCTKKTATTTKYRTVTPLRFVAAIPTSTKIQRKFKGNAKDNSQQVQRKYKETQRKHKRTAMEIQRKCKGNTMNKQRKCKGHTKEIQQVTSAFRSIYTSLNSIVFPLHVLCMFFVSSFVYPLYVLCISCVLPLYYLLRVLCVCICISSVCPLCESPFDFLCMSCVFPSRFL